MTVLAINIAFPAIIFLLWYTAAGGGVAINGYFNTPEYRIEYIEREITGPVVFGRHCHAQYEMVTLVDGDISILIDGKQYPMSRNQTVIHPPMLYHAILANSPCTYKRVNAFFDLSAVPAPLQESFRQKTSEVVFFTSESALELKGLCAAETPDYYNYYRAQVQSLMTLMFYQFTENDLTLPAPRKTDPVTQEIISYIDRNLDKKITLEDLAAHTFRSQSAIVHCFRKSMGISIKQYILQKKMVLAQQMIQNNVPMSVAAAEIGYDNYSSFYRAYTKHVTNESGS